MSATPGESVQVRMVDTCQRCRITRPLLVGLSFCDDCLRETGNMDVHRQEANDGR